MSMPVFHEEAKLENTLCPFTFSIPEIRGPDWNGVREGGPWPCAGKRCMAWRFARTNILSPSGGGTIASDDTHGYCGLAGIPGAAER